MKIISFLACSLIVNFVTAQAPAVYINFVSHNEPADILNQDPEYSASKAYVLQLAAIIDSYQAAWNLETCDRFVAGALSVEGQANNVFRTLSTNYPNYIEVDPRSKNWMVGNNIADTYHLLDSLGANPTTTLGGFIYSSPAMPPIDWFDYEVTKYSTSPNYPTVAWNCNIIWGAGSPNHSNDFYDWGIWKPKAASTSNTFNDFYQHEPLNNIWYIGSGCPPDGTVNPANPGSFDPTDNVSDVTGPLKSFIDSIQNNQLPQDKFYSYSITINQSDFGPTLFAKISQICDSVQLWGATKIKWGTLTQKLTAFQTWSAANSNAISQWQCGETLGLNENDGIEFEFYPNPASNNFTIKTNDNDSHLFKVHDILGNLIFEKTTSNQLVTDVSNWSNGLYIVSIDDRSIRKFIKE